VSPSVSEAGAGRDLCPDLLKRGNTSLMMRTGRVQCLRIKVNLPPGALQVIVDTKNFYCLTLLTINTMPAAITAHFQAQDQLQASCHSLGMNAGEFSSSS
jgi:hypothetical protein